MAGRLSIALLGLVAAAAVNAETAYVTDLLQLGLHRASDTSDRAFANLSSGARLEVLERNRNYARVRTDAGEEGWVKTAYIVAETPARYRLTELETQVETLGGELAAARATEAQAADEANRLRGQESERHAMLGALRDRAVELERRNAEYAEQLRLYRGSLPLSWVLAALVLTFVGGGAVGWWALDLLSRRRHYGYRVY